MNIIICDPANFAHTAADKIAELIFAFQLNPYKMVNLVLATGNTMVEFLDLLSKKENIDWARVRAFHLDEYKGLPTDHPSSFAYFLNKNLFSKVPIPRENINYINGTQPDLDAYIKKLKDNGGADILMLGIGMDGHLAFNEPPLYSNFDSRMREVHLSSSTLDANRPDYPDIDQNPTAYTMGMADIFEAKNIFFLANKLKKAEIIKKAFEGPVTHEVPASLLQKHSGCTVILDYPAASLLETSMIPSTKI